MRKATRKTIGAIAGAIALATFGSAIGVALFGLSATAQTLKFGTDGIEFAEDTLLYLS